MRRFLLLLNVAGGLAIAGTLAWGLAVHPGMIEGLQGAIPESWQPWMDLDLLPAVAGYILLATYVLFRVDPARATFPEGLSYGALVAPFLAILIPTALWLPLTFPFAEASGSGLRMALRIVLTIVGLGAAVLVWMLAGLRPRDHRVHWALSLAGSAAILIQAGVLDVLVGTDRFGG